MNKTYALLAAIALFIVFSLLPAQAESTPLPVVIDGTDGNAAIVFMEDGRFSSGEVISMWSDGRDGLYFLGKIENNQYAGLFHWKKNDQQVALIHLSEAETMKDAYPKDSVNPVLLPGGFCATTDSDMIRIAPQKQPSAPKRTLSILSYDDGVDHVPLSVINFIVKNPDIDVHYIDADHLDFDDNVIGRDEKVDIIISSSNYLESYCDADHSILALNSSPRIVEASRAYYPELRGTFTDGDDVIAVPMEIYSCHWGLDQQGWEMLGLPDFPQTFKELVDFSVLWETEYAKKYPDYPFVNHTDYIYSLIANMLEQYVSLYATEEQALDFDRLVLRENIQYIYDSLWYEQPTWRNDDLLLGTQKP